MPSGRKAYADLGRQVDSLRQEISREAAALSALGARLEQEQAGENRLVAELARLHLDQLQARQADARASAGEREARAHLARREAAIRDCEAAIVQSRRQQAELESRRREHADERDRKVLQLDRDHAAAAERTRATAQWQALAARSDRLAGQAALALEKAQQAHADRQAKGRPYESDRLFMYLWQRDYGGAGYRAGPLVRFLDGWVAGLVGWRESARNYRLLTALPAQLERHAQSLQAQAETAAAEQAALEQAALEAAGVPALAEQVQALEAAIDELSAGIDSEEQRHAQWLAERSRLAEGSDRHTGAALAALARAIAAQPAPSLRQAAAATPEPEDDALALRIGRLRQTQQQLQAQLERGRGEHQARLAALQRLEELRRRFRERQYDAGDSEIGDGAEWGDLIGGVLRGALELGRAWERIERNQRFRLPRGRGPSGPPPGIFGSGRPRSGGFGGGGFKGGGGFGGGGFKTGGGF